MNSVKTLKVVHFKILFLKKRWKKKMGEGPGEGEVEEVHFDNPSVQSLSHVQLFATP